MQGYTNAYTGAVTQFSGYDTISDGVESGTEEAGRKESGGAQAERATQIRSKTEADGAVTLNSSKEIGITNGTDSKRVRIVPAAYYTEEMTQDAERLEKQGTAVVYFTNSLEINDGRETFYARGAINKDGNIIYVQADHATLSPAQILKHEEYHKKVKENPNLNKEIRDRIVAEYGEGAIEYLADAYTELYFTAEDGTVTADSDYILEEILADAYAGIDVLTENSAATTRATEFTEAAEEGVAQSRSGDGNAGETRYSLSKTKVERCTEIIRAINKNPIEKMAGNKKIHIYTDEYTVDKAIFSMKGRSNREVNARIAAIPDFSKIVKSSLFSKTESEIKLTNKAKNGVIAMHYFTGEYKGWSVEVVVRDKGKRQYLYEIKFKKNNPQQTIPNKNGLPAPDGDVEDYEGNYNSSTQKSNGKFSREVDAKYLAAVKSGDTAEAQKLVDEAAQEGVAQSQSGDGNAGTATKYAREIEKEFVPELEKVLSGKSNYETSHLKIGATPEYYAKFGLDTKLPMMITARHVKDVTTPFNGINSNYHGLTEKQLVKALKDAENPAIVFYSPSLDGTLVVVTNQVVTEPQTGKKEPISLFIMPDATGKLYGMQVQTNIVKSSYARINSGLYIARAFYENRVMDYDKARSQQIRQIPGVQFPNNLPSVDFNKSIADYKALVKKKSMQNGAKNSRVLDEKYLAAVKSGDTVAAQKLVDEAAKEAGYTVKAYHGTTAKRFNEFAPNSYFSPNYKYAEQYSHVLQADGTNEPKVFTVYLKPGNVKNVPFSAVRPLAYQMLDKAKRNTMLVKAPLFENGVPELIVKNPEQIKSADPVTYDDDGKIIPLSERFNAKKADIRYSRDYSYESLVKKPDMQLTEVDDSIQYKPTPEARKNIVARAIFEAKKVGKINEAGNAVVHVKDTDTDVLIGKRGLMHGLDGRMAENAPVTLKIGSILENSVKINELTPKTDEAEKSYVLIGAAKNGMGKLCIVRSVVNRQSNELASIDVLYAVNAKKDGTAVLNAPLLSRADYRTIVESAVLNAPAFTEKPRRITDSTISISSLLDYVNRYFPDVLPESVLRHYGYDARPEGKLGESALYSREYAPTAEKNVKELKAQRDRLEKALAQERKNVSYWRAQAS
jgi:hypothetical protein